MCFHVCHPGDQQHCSQSRLQSHCHSYSHQEPPWGCGQRSTDTLQAACTSMLSTTSPQSFNRSHFCLAYLTLPCNSTPALYFTDPVDLSSWKSMHPDISEDKIDLTLWSPQVQHSENSRVSWPHPLLLATGASCLPRQPEPGGRWTCHRTCHAANRTPAGGGRAT